MLKLFPLKYIWIMWQSFWKEVVLCNIPIQLQYWFLIFSSLENIFIIIRLSYKNFVWIFHYIIFFISDNHYQRKLETSKINYVVVMVIIFLRILIDILALLLLKTTKYSYTKSDMQDKHRMKKIQNPISHILLLVLCFDRILSRTYHYKDSPFNLTL